MVVHRLKACIGLAVLIALGVLVGSVGASFASGPEDRSQEAGDEPETAPLEMFREAARLRDMGLDASVKHGELVVNHRGVAHLVIVSPAGDGEPWLIDKAAIEGFDIAQSDMICDQDATVEEFNEAKYRELIKSGSKALPPCEGLPFSDGYVDLADGIRSVPVNDLSGAIRAYAGGDIGFVLAEAANDVDVLRCAAAVHAAVGPESHEKILKEDCTAEAAKRFGG